jgi:hypothetical protein
VKFFLEILVLLILFILLRQALLHLFPPAQVNVQLSAASRRAFKRYRLRYALLYTALGLIFTVLLVLFFRFLFNQIHQDSAWELQYAINTISLIMPGLLLGFLLAHLAARPILARFQKDGLAFFMEELQELWVGWARERLLLWHMLLVLVLAGGMLVLQLSVGFAVNEERLLYETPLGERQERSPQDIEKMVGEDPPQLIFTDGDTLSMGYFNYDRAELRAYFQKQIEQP